MAGQNCSSFLHIPLSSHFPDKKDESQISDYYNPSNGCPPWYYYSSNHCIFGDNLDRVLKDDTHLMQTSIQHFYCMTVSNTTGTSVVGRCLFSAFHYCSLPYVPLPCNISELNDYTCADLNREGQLCGRCQDRFAPPVYSYSMQCVNCTDYRFGWAKYLLIAFVPLTAFFILIVTCHISPTSPYLHGPILFSHVFSLPMLSRIFVLDIEFHDSIAKPFGNVWLIYLSLFGLWNFDFFLLLYTPFCIHPDMTILQVLAIDYLIALYPIVLLFLTYFTIQLHRRTFKPLCLLFKPFSHIFRSIKSKLHRKHSLVDSFAAVFLLSTIKFQSVTFDLLVPTRIYYMNGSSDGKLYLFLAGDVEYFGPQHLPYAIAAIVVFITLIIIPALLMFLYPCRCCQKLLDKTHCNCVYLHTFMDAFQGNYKDGANNTRDYRYFAGVFFLLRTVFIVVMPWLNSYYALTLMGLISSAVALSVALLHPQRSRHHYCIDSLFLLVLSALLFGANITNYRYSQHSANTLSTHTALFSLLLIPLVYMVGLISWWIFWRNQVQCVVQKYCLGMWTRCYTRCLQVKCCEVQTEENEHQHLIAIP